MPARTRTWSRFATRRLESVIAFAIPVDWPFPSPAVLPPAPTVVTPPVGVGVAVFVLLVLLVVVVADAVVVTGAVVAVTGGAVVVGGDEVVGGLVVGDVPAGTVPGSATPPKSAVHHQTPFASCAAPMPTTVKSASRMFARCPGEAIQAATTSLGCA